MEQEKVLGGEITNYGDNPRKKLLSVTMVAILSIIAVVSVYAVLIGSFIGGDVTIGGVTSSNIRYSLTNVDGIWDATLVFNGTATPWYARLEIPSGGYSGPVEMTWHLEQKNATWIDVPGTTIATSIVLNSTAIKVYASTDGGITGNGNWATSVLMTGTYRVNVDVNSV